MIIVEAVLEGGVTIKFEDARGYRRIFKSKRLSDILKTSFRSRRVVITRDIDGLITTYGIRFKTTDILKSVAKLYLKTNERIEDPLIIAFGKYPDA